MQCNLVKLLINNDWEKQLKAPYLFRNLLDINVWEDDGRIISTAGSKLADGRVK